MKRSDYVFIPSSRRQDLTKAGLLAALSGLLFSACSVGLPHLGSYPPGLVSFLLLATQLIFSIPWVVLFPSHFLQLICGRRTLTLALCLGVVLAASNVSWAYSMTAVGVVEGNVILVSYPVFAVVVSHFLLKERFDLFHGVTLVVATTGILLVTKLPVIVFRSNFNALGLCVAFLGMVCNIATSIILRLLAEFNFQALFLSSSPGGVIASAVLTLAVEGVVFFNCGGDAAWALCLCALTFLGQLLFSLSLQVGEVGLVSLVRTGADILFLFVLQAAWHRQSPDPFTILGAFLVTSSVMVLTAREHVCKLLGKLVKQKTLD